MTEKMVCPACDSYTSSVLRAYDKGEPCPVCGLSASAALEVMSAQERGANADLMAKCEQAVIERDKAQREAAQLQRKLTRISNAIRDALNDD